MPLRIPYSLFNLIQNALPPVPPEQIKTKIKDYIDIPPAFFVFVVVVIFIMVRGIKKGENGSGIGSTLNRIEISWGWS